MCKWPTGVVSFDFFFMLAADHSLPACTVSGLPGTVAEVAAHYGYKELLPCIRRFLYDQLNPNAEVAGDQVELNCCPTFKSCLKVFKSATATYYAPSDQSGKGGMRRDLIRCTESWRGGPARKDCVFVENGGAEGEGLRGLLVARVQLLFSFVHDRKIYNCVLVNWYLPVGDEPDITTGMWIVAPEVDRQDRRIRAVISLDTVLRPAHLIGVYGEEELPVDFHFADSLDAFRTYYVNKYSDHHAHVIAF